MTSHAARSESRPEYVLGVNDAEIARLGLQHRLWSEAAHALWERAGVRPGLRVLDLGCGPGYTTSDLALLVGASGRVVAVDEAGRYIDVLRARAAALGLTNIEAHVGDVQNLDPAIAPAGAFDIAHQRWVMCFIPDVEGMVAGVARALRPSGVFAVQDYFNYEALSLAPRSPRLARMVEAITTAWRARGGDPDVVARLPGLMARHGIETVEIQPIVRCARPGHMMWAWPDSFFRTFLPTLVPSGYATQDEVDGFLEEWTERSSDPASFMMTPPVWSVIGVKR